MQRMHFTVHFLYVPASLDSELVCLDFGFDSGLAVLDLSLDSRLECVDLKHNSGLACLDLGLSFLYLGPDSQLESKDLELTCNLQKNDFVPPLHIIISYK